MKGRWRRRGLAVSRRYESKTWRRFWMTLCNGFGHGFLHFSMDFLCSQERERDRQSYRDRERLTDRQPSWDGETAIPGQIQTDRERGGWERNIDRTRVISEKTWSRIWRGSIPLRITGNFFLGESHWNRVRLCWADGGNDNICCYRMSRGRNWRFSSSDWIGFPWRKKEMKVVWMVCEKKEKRELTN